MVTIILSSPHGLCPKSISRRCDLVAIPVAEELQSSLRQYKSTINTIYSQGTEYRHDHDLNRKKSRNTPYRKNLLQVFKTYSKNSILVDVHSFPDYWMVEAGDINFFKKDEPAPDIVILQGPCDLYKGVSLSKTLYENLRLRFTSKIIDNITVNDIMNQGKEFNIPGVLLEFNEKYAEDQDGLELLVNFISAILKDIITKNS